MTDSALEAEIGLVDTPNTRPLTTDILAGMAGNTPPCHVASHLLQQAVDDIRWVRRNEHKLGLPDRDSVHLVAEARGVLDRIDAHLHEEFARATDRMLRDGVRHPYALSMDTMTMIESIDSIRNDIESLGIA